MNTFTYTKAAKINNVNATITQESKYPIPWSGTKNNRPVDYFNQIKTQINYSEHENNVTIFIPPVKKSEENRKRKIEVRINDKEYPFNSAGLAILDMNETFDLPEMQKLLTIATQAQELPNDDRLTLTTQAQKLPNDDRMMRACLPFYYMEKANYKPPNEKSKYVGNDGGLIKTHGNIEQLVAPYIESMTAHPGKRKELYIPVATLGSPHHWNVCILTINEQDVPSITYLESSPGALGKDKYLSFYKDFIIPGVNKVLKQNGYKKIKKDDLILYASKQFSQKGCGIAVSINIGNLFNDSLKVKKDLSHSYPELTIEEDAIRRVQLALKLTQHDNYVSQWRNFYMEYHQQVLPGTHARQDAVLRELTTNPRFLKNKALEAFPPSSLSSLIEQIRKKILSKKAWHFGGIIGYSRYTADDGTTHIPQGIRKILNILNSKFLDEKEKIQYIHEIAKNKKENRLTSMWSFGLFMRSNDTKQFYAEIFKITSFAAQDSQRALMGKSNPD